VFGLIDIHSHILPGLDDGPATLDEAAAMVRLAAESGTTAIVATPHSNLQFAFDPAAVEDGVARLREAVDGAIAIHSGCDLHLTPENIEAALQRPEKYTINGGRYLLVEFSDFGIPTAALEILDRLLGAGIVPVITHPERNPCLKRGIEPVRSWVENGCLVQVTAQSLTGDFGRSAERAGWRLIRDGLAHFVASDAHGLRRRPPLLGEACKRVAAECGEDAARALFTDNPRAAVADEPVERVAPPQRRRRWWFGGW
jgi:protein-tyrosine phosphatase